MAPGEKTPPPERAATDESLDAERTKTDDELERRSADIEDGADLVLKTARDRADAVVAAARAVADAKLPMSSPTPLPLGDERRREDLIVDRERAMADRELEEERNARRRALAALLAQEREETDHSLLAERTRGDQVVTTRDDFLAMVSHDVRSLLGAVALNAEMLTAKLAGSNAAPATVFVQRIQSVTQRMSRLIGDLLDVASIEAGHLAVTPRRHDATELLRETVDTFQAAAALRGVSVRSVVRTDAVLAEYDHERILQVLANLVGNAIKVSPAPGRIDVVVDRVDDTVRFAVVDQGPGVAAGELARIFERYTRGSGPPERYHRTGLGLGLYISRCIVEAHAGRIWAENNPDGGASFYFTLPSATAASETP